MMIDLAKLAPALSGPDDEAAPVTRGLVRGMADELSRLRAQLAGVRSVEAVAQAVGA